MNMTERQTLGHNIYFLEKDQLPGILDIMKDQSNPSLEVLEFDLKELSDRKCRELEQYVNQCIK